MPEFPELSIVHVTDGAPRDRRWWGVRDLPTRDAYAAVRRRELAAAVGLAGVPESRLYSLGVPDLEASHNLPALASRLAEVLSALECDVLLTHAYEGGHPDHDASSFAVHAACHMLAQRTRRTPRVLEFTSYHAGPDGRFEGGVFLPARDSVEWEVALTGARRELKRRMLAAFSTQRAVVAHFKAESERVRLAPSYNFLAPPHSGRLFYEQFEWGGSGIEWCARARDAIASLALRWPGQRSARPSRAH